MILKPVVNHHNKLYLLYFIDESFIHNREAKFRILQDVLTDNIYNVNSGRIWSQYVHKAQK
jgi:hypothetical protein